MRISSSNVGMESARQYTTNMQHTMSMTVSSIVMTVSGNNIAGNDDAYKGKTFGEILSGEATEKENQLKDSLLGMNQGFFGIRQIKSADTKSPEEMIDEIRVRTITFLINLLSGAEKNDSERKKNSLLDMLLKDVKQNNGTAIADAGEITEVTPILMSASINTFTFEDHYEYSEAENTSFSTQGTVVTADGRELSFGIDMQMSRSFQEKFDLSIIQQNISYCDPLVINLDSNIAEMTDQKFLFDIDHDGELDEISRLSSNSGYLALDLNEDGKINDGSELFGTSSGNGFEDLKKYDSDGNGWIDENDEIWSKLLIWTQDEEGNDRVYHLADKGVGAICLKNTETDFSLNNEQTNEVNARIRNTGIFLYENGNVGTMQHVDLVKYEA